MSLVLQTNISVTLVLQDTPNLCKWQDYMAALPQRMTQSSGLTKIWSYKTPAQLLPGVKFEYSCRALRPIIYHVFDHGWSLLTEVLPGSDIHFLGMSERSSALKLCSVTIAKPTC